MKLVLFDDYRPGVVVDDRVYDIAEVLSDGERIAPAERLPTIIRDFAVLQEMIDRIVENGRPRALSDVVLRAPLPRPGKLLCARGNYREGSDREPWPLDLFLKSPEAVIGPDDTVVLPSRTTHRVFHHEAELAVVIGRRCRDFPLADAMENVFGYTAFIDVSARGGIGRADGASFLGKSYDTFGPLGPAVATAEEIGDPQDLDVRLWINGQLWQDYSTSDMEHAVAELVHFAGSVMTLYPGDVIACGTNHQQLGPLQDGDRVEIEIARVGRFAVNVRDDLHRTWPRERDVEIAERVRRSLPATGGGR